MHYLFFTNILCQTFFLKHDFLNDVKYRDKKNEIPAKIKIKNERNPCFFVLAYAYITKSEYRHGTKKVDSVVNMVKNV